MKLRRFGSSTWQSVCAVACLVLPAAAQQAVKLPEQPTTKQAEAQRFSFASDGPVGPGWARPDQIARVYVHEDLPTLFRRTIALDGVVPKQTRLSWIFTGPHAGFTVEMTGDTVRLEEREYASVGLHAPGAGEHILYDLQRQFTGRATTLSVVVDAHLAVTVLVNGEPMLWEPLMFDVTRHQLEFSGPRNQHMTLGGALLQEEPVEASVHVDAARPHQTMIGFGGSPSVPAYASLSPEGKAMYWDLMRRYNLLIDREYPMGTQLKQDLSNVEDLRDAAPHYYGDNFPNGEVSDFDYSRKAREMGGKVLYEMWALPKWATQSYTPEGKPAIDAWGKPVRIAAKPDVYAKIVVDFCRRAKERSGAAPEIIGIENEVEQAPEVFAAMTIAVRKALDEAGFQTTKIQMADAPYVWIQTQRVKDLKTHPEAWKATDFLAAHQYDYQQFLANPDMYDESLAALHAASDGKPFLATEICLNDTRYQEDSYRLALQVGQLYHKDLSQMDAEMLLYCWLILDIEQPNFGVSRSLLVPDRSNEYKPVASSFELRVLGAFSRHIPEGMHRVESISSNPDLLTTAFTDGKRMSLIVLNRSTSAAKLHVEWPGAQWTTEEITDFYRENKESSAPGEVIVQPGEILTLANFSAPR